MAAGFLLPWRCPSSSHPRRGRGRLSDKQKEDESNTEHKVEEGDAKLVEKVGTDTWEMVARMRKTVTYMSDL
ncbi:hypothetical protein PAMP_010262 [Pampus punctatissimus]